MAQEGRSHPASLVGTNNHRHYLRSAASSSSSKELQVIRRRVLGLRLSHCGDTCLLPLTTAADACDDDKCNRTTDLRGLDVPGGRGAVHAVGQMLRSHPPHQVSELLRECVVDDGCTDEEPDSGDGGNNGNETIQQWEGRAPPTTLGAVAAIAAGQTGHVGVLQLLHELGGDDALLRPDANGRTAAQRAARAGHVDCLRTIHACGAGPSLTRAHPADGATPAHFAAQQGHSRCLRQLHELGVSVCLADAYGDTPADLAAAYGHAECERVLFELTARQRLLVPARWLLLAAALACVACLWGYWLQMPIHPSFQEAGAASPFRNVVRPERISWHELQQRLLASQPPAVPTQVYGSPQQHWLNISQDLWSPRSLMRHSYDAGAGAQVVLHAIRRHQSVHALHEFIHHENSINGAGSHAKHSSTTSST
jgi:hypothetical protein